MKLKKGNNRVDALTEGNLKQVNNVLLYHNFLCQDDKDALVEDPVQWAKADFTKWKSNGYPLSTNALNASRVSNNANTNTTLQASNVTAPTSQTKLEDNAYLSWRRSKEDGTSYPVLENDREYTD